MQTVELTIRFEKGGKGNFVLICEGIISSKWLYVRTINDLIGTKPIYLQVKKSDTVSKSTSPTCHPEVSRILTMEDEPLLPVEELLKRDERVKLLIKHDPRIPEIEAYFQMKRCML